MTAKATKISAIFTQVAPFTYPLTMYIRYMFFYCLNTDWNIELSFSKLFTVLSLQVE